MLSVLLLGSLKNAHKACSGVWDHTVLRLGLSPCNAQYFDTLHGACGGDTSHACHSLVQLIFTTRKGPYCILSGMDDNLV